MITQDLREVSTRLASYEREQTELATLIDRDGENGLVAQMRTSRSRVHYLHQAVSVIFAQLPNLDPPSQDWPA